MDKDYSIGFTGDLSFSGYFAGQTGNSHLLDENIRDFFDSADANIINFESPITGCRHTDNKWLAHRSDPSALDFIKDNIKSPVISLANNHMMDFGTIGFIDSVENVKAAGIPLIGAGLTLSEASRCMILGNDEVKIGVIAMQYKSYRPEAEGRYARPFSEVCDHVLKERIEEFRAKVDWLVLVYHGGDEFLHAPMPYIRRLQKKYLSWGIDVIVAHHPHVVQGYEYFGEKAIFYSLGNFLFDTDYQRLQEGADSGMILKLTFTKDSFRADTLPIFIDRENLRVVKGEPDSHFRDLGKMNYRVFWKTEALRKEKVRAKAKKLQAEQQEKLKAAAAASGKAAPKKKPSAKAKLLRPLKKIYRKLFVNMKTNYRQMVVILGGKWAKLFYRNKKIG